MRHNTTMNVFALTAAAIVMLAGAPSAVANPFASLKGTWSGGGKIRLEGGQTERIRCKGYYTGATQSDLGIAIRCASASNKIEMRAKLQYSGGSITGSWEERTFNAAGDVTGRAKSGSIRLSINGTVSGSMNVSYGAKSQQVQISTPGSTLQSVTISMKKRS